MKLNETESMLVQRTACHRLAMTLLLSAVTDICAAVKAPNSEEKATLAADAFEWFNFEERHDKNIITFFACMSQVAECLDFATCDEESIEKACRKMAKQLESDPFAIQDSLQRRIDEMERHSHSSVPLRARSEVGRTAVLQH